MISIALLILLPNCITPENVDENDAFRNAMIAAIHQFGRDGELDHLKAIVEKYPELINERQTFRQPHKPLNTDGYSPLHQAARHDHEEIVEWLLENGAEVNANAGDGWTPLHIAAREGHLSIVKLLVKYDAKLDAKTDAIPESFEVPPSSPPGAKPQRSAAVPARTPLDVAVHFKHAEAAEFLRSANK